jgi:hypothetical protein
MTEIKVIVTGPEEAYDNEAGFWSGNELMGVTSCIRGACTCASRSALAIVAR